MLETILPARRRGRAPRRSCIAPLFPRRTPGGGVRRRSRRRCRSASASTRSATPAPCPSSRSRTRRRERAPLRRRGAARREAEPDPERDRARRRAERRWRSRSRASRRGAGAAARRASRSAPHAAHPELRRRKAQSLSAEPLARGIAQAEVWDEVRGKSARMARPLADRRAGGHLPLARGRAARARQAFPLVPGQCGALLALGDDALPRLPSRGRRRSRGSTRSCARATCSTRSSGSTGSRRRRSALARFVESVGAATRARGARPGSARTCGCTARASSARGSSSTASCSSSAPSRATRPAGGSRGRAAAAERRSADGCCSVCARPAARRRARAEHRHRLAHPRRAALAHRRRERALARGAARRGRHARDLPLRAPARLDARERRPIDPEHGPRAAAFAAELHAEGMLAITAAQLELLQHACSEHANGFVSTDPTVGACWDADRLDLPRVWITPDPALLSTERAQNGGHVKAEPPPWSVLYARIGG